MCGEEDDKIGEINGAGKRREERAKGGKVHDGGGREREWGRRAIECFRRAWFQLPVLTEARAPSWPISRPPSQFYLARTILSSETSRQCLSNLLRLISSHSHWRSTVAGIESAPSLPYHGIHLAPLIFMKDQHQIWSSRPI